VTDYMDGCARELDGLFATIRYTQRGTPPSTAGPPYTIESHAADALAVLDAARLERAWAIGHSWGGHLALHLAVMHHERLLGLVCIDPLGAPPDLFAEVGATFRRALRPDQVARIDEIEEMRRHGEATEADLRERMDMMWPLYFAEPEAAPASLLTGIGVECSTETNASIAEQFERGTLLESLPRVGLPALFVHGELDPLPVRSSTETAALIPGARVETIARCGHFPWLDRPGELRRAVERFLDD
jgi:pimeloyl-ACP methyl ester carboxylesterase